MADLKICLFTMDPGGARYLDPSGQGGEAWVSGERWFTPIKAEPTEGGVLVELGPEVTWHLRPHATYGMRLGTSPETARETRFPWPPIRLPSDAPPPAQAEEVPSPKSVEPPLPQEDSRQEASKELSDGGDPVSFGAEETPSDSGVEEKKDSPDIFVGERPPSTSGRSSLPLYIGLLAVLLMVCAGAGWWFLGGGSQVPEGPQLEMTVAGARGYLKDNPPAQDAAEKAALFDQAGSPDGAFLLRLYAARGGNSQAAKVLGKLYDPAHFTPGGVVKTANGDQAADYYEQAAKEGDPEAMTALANLLRSGLTTRSDAPEAAVYWDNAAAKARATATGKPSP